MKFVIQEHRAGDRIRYYLRLEKDGVLKGWALPKGMPKEWGKQRLALQVGDGDLSLLDFQGEIKEGKYGPGEIKAWDSGEYECHRWEEGKIVFTLNGPRIKGSYALVGFPKGGEKSWLLGQTKARRKPSPKSVKVEPAPREKAKSRGASPRKKRRRKYSYPSMRRRSILEWNKKDFRLVLWIAIFAALIYGAVQLIRWLF